MKQLLLLVIPILLHGCSSPPEGSFPSLSKRPFETNAPPPETKLQAPLPTALPGPLSAQIDELESRVQRSASAFQAALPAARSKANAARGAGVNSERWVAAHTQLSRLDRTRADAISAIAEMDQLVTGQLDRELIQGASSYSQLMIPRQRQMGDIVRSQGEILDALARTIGI